MTARRQASSTSLSKYMQGSPAYMDRNLDFCNAFWGLGDGGVDVLFARMRGATRTVEELRNFWKERASIEEDYAKRMGKLAKVVLGRDEIGDMRIALDTVKQETERQAQYHQTLAHQLRTELEGPTAALHARLLQHKKQQQAAIEKEFKNKQAQEAHVNKAREKYEADCVRINSFTAQSSLVQGKDLEKIMVKLERAQQTVQVNEKEFFNFTKVLQETSQKWEQSWKTFCDSCQDLEEERLMFMKDNLWAYTNEVSTVCVADDESCEKIRLSLEQMEPEVEMGNFVRDYGTGNEIPNPPQFINFNTPDAIPSSASRPSTRPASFVRSSTRELPSREPIEPADEEPPVNTAGVGAGSSSRHSLALDPTSVQGQESRSRNGVSPVNGQGQPYMNGGSSSNRPNPSAETNGNWNPVHRNPTVSAQPATPSGRVPQDPMAEPIDPNAETYIKVGANAYKVDLSRDPQQQSSMSSTHRSAPSSPVKSSAPAKQDGTVDPLQKQLLELQNAVSNTGSIRRNTLHRFSTAEQTKSISPPPSTSQASPPQAINNALKSLSPPGPTPIQSNRSPSPNRDYRNSADLVVGAHPSASASRPASPNPPTAAFMLPPSQSAQPPGTEVITEVLADYQQSLPGERKSISRSNSVNRPTNAQSPSHTAHQSVTSIDTQGQNGANQGHDLQRSNSRLGHVGIGAHGGSRSNSPLPQSRGPSPAPIAQAAPSAPPTARHSLASPSHNIARAPSPNSVGIALDPNGRVLHDEMAQGYQGPPGQAHRQSQPPPQQRPPQQVQQPVYHPPPAPSPQQQPAQRRTSYIPAAAPAPAPAIAPPAAPRMYAVTPPPPPPANVYQAPAPPAQPVYAPPPPATHPTYTPPSQLLYQQQQVAPPHQPSYQPPQQPVSTYGAPGAQRNSSAMSSNYYEPPQQQYPAQRQQAVNQPPYQQPGQQWNQGPSPVAVRRTPSPQPPPQPTTEDGSPILFYVKALYDYTATIDEEFDFQAGDIIAVTSTPEDGWWTGELLDEARRQRGRNVFPSNFVCLF